MGGLPMGVKPPASDLPRREPPENGRLPRNLFAVIVFIAMAKSIYDYPMLPDRLASHFAASGIPNGWMMKPPFFALYALLVVVSAAVGFLVPRAIATSSDSRTHLPHKEYWLAPERRVETFAFFRRHFAWYGCALLLTEVLAIELAIQANFHSPPRLPAGPLLFLIAAFAVFNLFWTVRIFRRFSKVGG